MGASVWPPCDYYSNSTAQPPTLCPRHLLRTTTNTYLLTLHALHDCLLPFSRLILSSWSSPSRSTCCLFNFARIWPTNGWLNGVLPTWRCHNAPGRIRCCTSNLAAKQSWWPPLSQPLFVRRTSTTIFWFSAEDWRSLQVR